MINHCTFIEELAKQIKPKNYLELGVYDGETLARVFKYAQKTTSVDIKDLRKSKVGIFYQMTTDKFFEQNTEKFDLIFIDADHCITSVIRDFENSVAVLSSGGIILLHDTDPENIRLVDPGYCGDAYKFNSWIDRTKFEVVTLPLTEAGLTIVKRIGENRSTNYE